MLWPPLPKGIFHTRGCWQSLAQTPQTPPHSTTLQTTCNGSRVCWSVTGDSSWGYDSLEVRLEGEKCPGINTLFMGVALDQSSRSKYIQLKGTAFSVSFSLCPQVGQFRHVFYVVFRVFLPRLNIPPYINPFLSPCLLSVSGAPCPSVRKCWHSHPCLFLRTPIKIHTHPCHRRCPHRTSISGLVPHRRPTLMWAVWCWHRAVHRLSALQTLYRMLNIEMISLSTLRLADTIDICEG